MLLVLATTSPALLLRPATPVGAPLCRVRRAAPVCAEPEGGALAQLGDQFEAALGSLPASERYNAVLESLLANKGQVEPALDLVEEMNLKRVKLSDKATKALLDFGSHVRGHPRKARLDMTSQSALCIGREMR